MWRSEFAGEVVANPARKSWDEGVWAAFFWVFRDQMVLSQKHHIL